MPRGKIKWRVPVDFRQLQPFSLPNTILILNKDTSWTVFHGISTTQQDTTPDKLKNYVPQVLSRKNLTERPNVKIERNVSKSRNHFRNLTKFVIVYIGDKLAVFLLLIMSPVQNTCCKGYLESGRIDCSYNWAPKTQRSGNYKVLRN